MALWVVIVLKGAALEQVWNTRAAMKPVII